ncbi:GntR family transcriptional regulator [Hansschlegelia sp.]|uniref:GntR family transcriptional regulator n=1 Tax=Hansschlegelia sp. TaxID=2041892 RepID=UPI002BC5EB22|nr:GntR family transcriptional regulator [Hansschlegelia sp.]HVI27890.1 GntR family transcriptional regulator [Hansschlegelia sp.]
MPNKCSVEIQPVGVRSSLRTLVYEALKAAITKMDVYDSAEEVRLDERKLSCDLGVSRTPVREALKVLEQQGFVRSKPRSGVFVVKKTKPEIIDIVHACAALESMAARLACARATTSQLSSLYDALIPSISDDRYFYSNGNIRFHREIILLGRCAAIDALSQDLLIHLRGIRNIALSEAGPAVGAKTSCVSIIKAIEHRDAELAAGLIRDRGLDLARMLT